MPNIVGLILFSLCFYFVIKFFPFVLASLAGLFLVGLIAVGLGGLYIRRIFKKAQKEYESMQSNDASSPFERRFEPQDSSTTDKDATVIHVEAETVSTDS